MKQTEVRLYTSVKAMNRGIRAFEDAGWNVVSTEQVDQGWGCLKTGCLGLIFLPLALLGKKPQSYQVTYQREV